MTMTPLFYGGFVFCVNSQSKIYKNQNTLYGYVLDNNYPNIETTYPRINGIISAGSKEINVTYTSPIVPSTNNNITIYQINNNDDRNILRESFPADSSYCKISDDRKTLSIQVLTST